MAALTKLVGILTFMMLLSAYLNNHSVGGVEIPARHGRYIRSVVQKFVETRGQYPSGIIQPPVTSLEDADSGTIPNFIDYTLPTIIVWHPILTYGSGSKNGLRCVQCDKEAVVGYWNDGMSHYNQPRLLHDVDECVLLVSAVYVCSEQHKVLAHDERVLKQLPEKIKFTVPFILLHQTGFTKRFVELCQSLCQTGMNFHSLEGVIGNMRWKKYEEKRQLYQHMVDSYKQSHQIEMEGNVHTYELIPTFEDSIYYKCLPSDDIIGKCFLANFLENEQYFRREIQCVDTGEELSFDHTFKIATNIGFLRDDNKWVCQYDSVFLVFNVQGKIVSWQFTKGTGFDHVKILLEHIQRRSQLQGHNIRIVYVDNCCQWRAKIQSVFGEQVKVLLDIFHAVQRVSKTIPKRHPFHSACLQDLRLVFRTPGDYGEKRTKPTPSPDNIIKNLEIFSERWCGVSYDNRYLFSESTKVEIEKLKVHAKKGCLSDIDVGGGTNRNEAFHRYVNTFFHKSRLGILLSYALMMTIIHQYNSKIRNSRKCIFVPVQRSQSDNAESDEPMGIAQSTENTSDHSWHQEHSDNDTISTSSIVDILQVSLSQLNVCKTMRTQTKTASPLLKYIPFAQMLPCIHQGAGASQDLNLTQHKTRLKTTLRSWNFTLLPVVPDGNCFFTSVAIALVNGGEQLREVIASTGLSLNAPLTVLALKLRELIVQEWLGEHRYEYECFTSTESSFEAEATNFLQNGHYDSELGNTMPLAMANALKVTFVVFTSLSSSPIFFVTPREPSTDVLYLAFTYCGPGHYDGAIFTGESATVRVKCRCGVNSHDKENQVACSHQGGRHSSCKCLAAGNACSSSCGCKGCGNPHGVRPSNLGKRKREQHVWQKLTVSNKKFAVDRGEALVQGVWSEFENMVFSNSLRYIELNQLDCDTSSLDIVFNSVAKYTSAPYCTVSLPPDAVLRIKTDIQFSCKLQHFQQEKELFNQICTQ